MPVRAAVRLRSPQGCEDVGGLGPMYINQCSFVSHSTSQLVARRRRNRQQRHEPQQVLAAGQAIVMWRYNREHKERPVLTVNTRGLSRGKYPPAGECHTCQAKCDTPASDLDCSPCSLTHLLLTCLLVQV